MKDAELGTFKIHFAQNMLKFFFSEPEPPNFCESWLCDGPTGAGSATAMWWFLLLTLAAAQDICEFTSEKASVAFDLTDELVAFVVREGSEKVVVEVEATVDLETVIYPTDGGYGDNPCSLGELCEDVVRIERDGTRFDVCAGTCIENRTLQYWDLATYVIRGSPKRGSLYMVVDPVEDDYNILLRPFGQGTATMSFLFDCPASCSSCTIFDPTEDHDYILPSTAVSTGDSDGPSEVVEDAGDGGRGIGRFFTGILAASVAVSAASPKSGLRSSAWYVVGLALLGQLTAVRKSTTPAAAFQRGLTREFRWTTVQWGEITEDEDEDDEDDDPLYAPTSAPSSTLWPTLNPTLTPSYQPTIRSFNPAPTVSRRRRRKLLFGPDDDNEIGFLMDHRNLRDTSASARRCKTRRFADVVITVLLIAAAMVFLHTFLYATTVGLRYAAAGEKIDDLAVARSKIADDAVLWPRTLWPFVPFLVIAIALAAGQPLAVARCWAEGWAVLTLVTFLAALGLYVVVLLRKIARHLPNHAHFESTHVADDKVYIQQDPQKKGGAPPSADDDDDSLEPEEDEEAPVEEAKTPSTIAAREVSSPKKRSILRVATPFAVGSATWRAMRWGEPIYEAFTSGEWVASVKSRFLASHGVAFEDYLPGYAKTAELCLMLPQITVAFIIGISRRDTAAQAWVVAFIEGLVLIYVLIARPFVNDAHNFFEVIAASANGLAAFFIAAAASSEDRDAENGLFVVAVTLELLGLILVVGLQFIACLGCLGHMSFRVAKDTAVSFRFSPSKKPLSPTNSEVRPRSTTCDSDGRTSEATTSVADRSTDVAASTMASNALLLVADSTHLSEGVAGNALHIATAGVSLFKAIQVAKDSETFSFTAFLVNFGVLSLDELKFLVLWTLTTKPMRLPDDDDDQKKPGDDKPVIDLEKISTPTNASIELSSPSSVVEEKQEFFDGDDDDDDDSPHFDSASEDSGEDDDDDDSSSHADPDDDADA